MGTQSKRKKATPDNRSVTADIKRETDQDAVRTAILPKFAGLQYSPQLISQTDYVDVWDTINSSQGNAPAGPAQITGLDVTVGANNFTLNLVWTASGSPGVVSYNIYRGTTSGGEVLIDTVSAPTVTYSDDGLIAGTIYYYKVSAVNNYPMEGPLSVEDSATTSGTAPPVSAATLWLALDNNFLDSSTNAIPRFQYPPFAAYTPNGFGTPGKFGSHYFKCSTPSEMIMGYHDFIGYDLGNSPILSPDFTIGFSLSIWIQPKDISALSANRIIAECRVDNNNQFSLQLDSAGILYFFVRKAGSSIRQQVTGVTINNWHHIAAVYDAVANTVKLYRNAVSGGSSAASTNYGVYDGNLYFGIRGGTVDDGHYEGYYDEIQYFNGRVLTPTEVTNLMNTNAP